MSQLPLFPKTRGRPLGSKNKHRTPRSQQEPVGLDPISAEILCMDSGHQWSRYASDHMLLCFRCLRCKHEYERKMTPEERAVVRKLIKMPSKWEGIRK